jgi:hypothetical protein
MLENLTCEIFAWHLSTHFQVGCRAAHSAALQLAEASTALMPQGYEACSTVCSRPPAALLPQGIQRFHHDAIGAFDLVTATHTPTTSGTER